MKSKCSSFSRNFIGHGKLRKHFILKPTNQRFVLPAKEVEIIVLLSAAKNMPSNQNIPWPLLEAEISIGDLA